MEKVSKEMDIEFIVGTVFAILALFFLFGVCFGIVCFFRMFDFAFRKFDNWLRNSTIQKHHRWF